MPLWCAHSNMQRKLLEITHPGIWSEPRGRFIWKLGGVYKNGGSPMRRPGRVVLFRSVTGLLLSKNRNSKQAGSLGHLARPRQENRYRMSRKTTIIQRALQWTCKQ